MSTFDVTRIKGGWRVAQDGLFVDVDGAHLDKGAIRATLSVRKNDVLLYLDTVNSSGRSRA